jgi:2-polyprenyl-3-methyl-5-hydroxy-6-metoxy-1,4-benzoquinol methylase
MLDNQILTINKMPLYWRIKNDSSDKHNFIDDSVNFICYYDEILNLVKQKVDASLKNTLNLIYKEEFNVGYLQDEHTMSKGYGDDLMSFIENTLKNCDVKTILEIGCGGCYILEKLKLQGYDVVGIDPSPIASKNGDKKKLNVINDFYPSKHYNKKADVIFHSDVLEHMDNPVEFLKLQYDGLTENGILIISVPDCTESIQLGDVSMFLHQHINYFDQTSLRNAVQKAGFRVIELKKAGYGGSLYCSAVKDNSLHTPETKSDIHENKYLLEANKKIENFGNLIQKIVDEQKTIGFYMPLRAIPYLATLNDFDNFRIFDDTVHWHYKYIDGLNIKIENFEDLEQNPVDVLFVMSLTFAEIIKKKVQNSKIQNLDIFTLDSMLNDL